ncbi:MAG: peptidyl-prolyl cis-trans isomerase [Myxococcales bacterium]|nr:peptidyl-prolyl cis-trans isomerase [Myxococcales bacterium]
MRVSSPAAPLLIAILAMVACQPEPTVAPAPTAAPRDEGIVVPDDAYAIAGGVTIPRLAFDEALAKLSSGGPASRDDRGLRQRVGLALVTRALVGRELERLGLRDAAELERRALPLTLALERERGAVAPTWWSIPPLSSEDLPGAVVVAADLVVAAPQEELAAEYERQKDRWTSEKPWLRLDVWSLRYDDAVGVPECDGYIAKYRRCTAKFPAATQPTVLADLSRQASQWRLAAEDPERRELLRTECGAVETEAMQQTASMGCDWNTDATSAERKATAARRAELRGSGESARARLAAGEDLVAVTAAAGGVAGAGAMLSSDELPKSVVAAAKGLAVGKASKLVDDGHAWTVVRLVERHPAGTLPLEAVARDVADDLRIRRLAEALEALPTTLRGKYEVVLHASVESLDAGP